MPLKFRSATRYARGRPRKLALQAIRETGLFVSVRSGRCTARAEQLSCEASRVQPLAQPLPGGRLACACAPGGPANQPRREPPGWASAARPRRSWQTGSGHPAAAAWNCSRIRQASPRSRRRRCSTGARVLPIPAPARCRVRRGRRYRIFLRQGKDRRSLRCCGLEEGLQHFKPTARASNKLPF